MIKALSSTSHVRSRRGFTLLELIAVMGIIVALSLVIVGGYSGMMRTVSEMAGVNALRRGAMLARQHATIDGRDTYFFLTGFDTYVLCRRAGVISEHVTTPLSNEFRPAYLPLGTYSDAIWLYDQYSDLSAAAESFAGIGASGELTADQLDETLSDDQYSGTLLFDLTDGELARVKYPPWFEYQTDRWVMGIDKEAKGFKNKSAYGWTIYPEQNLPKGYAFVDGKDNFIEEYNFFFKPDGTADTEKNKLEISIQELSSGKVSKIKINVNGKIESVF